VRIDQFISGDALDRVVDVVVLVALDGSLLDANDAALECYGYSRDEMLGLTIGDIRIPKEDDNPDPQHQLAADPRKWHEAEHRRKDGSVFPVEVRAATVVIDGETAMLGTIRDVTDRRDAEAALRASEAKHSSMISNISDVIGIMGVDGIMKYKSPNIEKWFGWKPEDLVGTDGWLTVHPDDIERLQRDFMSILQADGLAATVEYRYLCKDGSYKWIELTATNLANDPIIGGVLLNYHDITERKTMERLGRELTSIIDVIGTVSEMRDPYTAGHQRRVSELATAIAVDLGLAESDVEDIRVAGLLHDIGKMSVPVEILSMPRVLSPAEYSLVKGHAEAGYNIIASAHMPDPIAELVHQHHERCDGSGYPRGLTAGDLLQGGKVLMVADVVEAMMSHRPYRPALGAEVALAEIEKGAGTLYDPAVASSCVRIIRDGVFAFSEV
jgi:PAS domain S-box-containing protein/putative nucleotidyltransferase with HDIG domain